MGECGSSRGATGGGFVAVPVSLVGATPTRTTSVDHGAEQRLRRRKVLQAMGAQRLDPDHVTDQRTGSGRQQQLPPAGRRRDPSCTVNLEGRHKPVRRRSTYPTCRPIRTASSPTTAAAAGTMVPGGMGGPVHSGPLLGFVSPGAK
jgi:hypothetical protein